MIPIDYLNRLNLKRVIKSCLDEDLFIFLQEVGFPYFTVVLKGGKQEGRQNPNTPFISVISFRIKPLYLQEEALIRAGRVVGRQVGGDQQELGVIRQFNVSVSRQT